MRKKSFYIHAFRFLEVSVSLTHSPHCIVSHLNINVEYFHTHTHPFLNQQNQEKFADLLYVM